jgi:molecular chaperone DnaK
VCNAAFVLASLPSQLVYSTEKLLSENKDKIDADTTAKVEKAVADVKAAREAGELKDLREKLTALQQESMKIGQVCDAA